MHSTMTAALLALSLASVGCGVLPPTSVEEALASGDEYDVNVQGFTPQEQIVMGECFADWKAFSGGRVQLRAVVGEGVLTVHRGQHPGGKSAPAHVSTGTRQAWLDPDNAHKLSLATLCRHAVGRALGLKIQEAPGVMCNYLDGVGSTFTESDHVECVAVGVCEE